MRLLILIRHGHDEGTKLSGVGKQTIERLGKDLLTRVGEGKRLILSSTLARAMETAGILADHLACSVRGNDTFVSGGGTREDLPKALDLIRATAQETDVLLVVTHYEYVEQLPAYIGTHTMPEGTQFPRRAIGKGEAWVIDCDAKTCVHVVV